MAVKFLNVSMSLTFDEFEFCRQNPVLTAHVDSMAMRKMADCLQQFVQVEDMPDDVKNFRKERRYSIVVGDISDQMEIHAAIEERAKELANQRINAAVEVAVDNIREWGLGWPDIRKDFAIIIIRKAFSETAGA